MSADKPDGTVARTKAFGAQNRLVEFGRHKETLLSHLRKACSGNAKATFDTERAWHEVEFVARLYYAKESVKRRSLTSAKRTARCRQIAEILGRARKLVDGALKEPDPALANDLMSGWWEGTGEYAKAEGRWVDHLFIQREFKKALESLAALQAGAARAADAAHRGRGRPRGTPVLPPTFIYSLASVYRSSTGSKPGAGDGPFVRFVSAFATGCGLNITPDHVKDSIKDLRIHSLQNPASLPSPFDA